MPIDFEQLLAKSPNPYVILRPDLHIVWMNDAYLRATMRRREELTGAALFDAFPSDPGSDGHRQLVRSFERVVATREPDELALIRYDIARPDGDLDVRYWSATHTPMLTPTGELRYILQHTTDVTELHELRRRDAEMDVVRRADAVERRNRNLAEESRRLKHLFEQAPGFTAVLSGPTHCFEMTNESYRKLVGRRDIVGRTVAEALPEVAEQGFIDILDTVLATGEPYFGRREAMTLTDPAEGESRRFLNFIFQPIMDAHDTPSGIIVQGNDVTDEVEAEQRQSLLINELNHRVKNTLGIVQGLALQSFRTVEGAGAARQVFNARLRALAAAHTLLTQSNWKAAPMRQIVHHAVEATAGAVEARVGIAGPDFALDPQTAVSLSMVVHELSTNALKYGALSTDRGQVEVAWTIQREREGARLTFTWRESGGPAPDVEGGREGFGMRLIRGGIGNDPAGRVSLDFPATGLVCRMETGIKDAAR